ncbi:endo-beta-galactosidase [Nocardioides baekrokdamisoli]|uniref:Endo-beta-galactosidase n=1 Tax=Nocardioides baekrokdamisoli TaxID=1804624 RepID=A0A3G9IGE7_9ACTN|nr:glycoside hydrolase family 16 protein [Nocardioides baekrokdamisoli]BBH17342.1 endo-beta-galactosidase [Nocardioides baekrokdamisoli]
MINARRAAPALAAALVLVAVVAALLWQHQRQADVAALLTQPCGPPIYKADGTAWACTFDDEFDGTSLDRSKWQVQTEFVSGSVHDGYACYIDDPAAVSVGGGTLHLTVRKTGTMRSCQGLPKPTPYIAGMVNTYHRFSQQYGRFEVRMKNTATVVPGLHEAFWLWPDDRYVKLNWPSTGEFDVVETYSLYPHVGLPYLHYGATDNDGWIKGVNTQWTCAAERGEWNTYTLEWDRKALTISMNGKVCLVNTAHPVAFAERYILNLTAALGESHNSMSDKTPIPATTLVDYVRVWK